MPELFFYPHPNLRDRQLDTIRLWPRAAVINPDVGAQKPYHYSAQSVLRRFVPRSWHQYLPAINIKLRPHAAPSDATVYCWGGIISHGPFVVELDNPYCLTAYNVAALRLYRPVLRRLLLSDRCRQIRCISRACHDTLRIELGEDVGEKAGIYYPLLSDLDRTHVPHPPGRMIKILFISTHFELKGGASILRVMEKLQAEGVDCHLTLVTHLPENYQSVVQNLQNVTYVRADLKRAELVQLYKTHDIFWHPTYGDSFGMVVWEALAHGMAILANDVYALREMVLPGYNGYLVTPPTATWCAVLPGPHFSSNRQVVCAAAKTNLQHFERQYCTTLRELIERKEKLFAFKQFSQNHFAHLSDQPHYFELQESPSCF